MTNIFSLFFTFLSQDEETKLSLIKSYGICNNEKPTTHKEVISVGADMDFVTNYTLMVFWVMGSTQKYK